MPIAFLVPAVLAGLVALAVPLVIHLRRRERERPMLFPSLMFLQRVTITTARRRRITDWPLLLVRGAIVALAVLAFSRPVTRPGPHAVPAAGTRRVVLVLDRSLSMGHQAVWPAARDSARAVVNSLAPGDRVAVVAFDDDAAVEQSLTTDHAAVLAAIGRVHPGSRGTRFGTGIRAARELLAKEADFTGGEILVISDLQRSGSAGLAGLMLPPSVSLRAISAAPRPHGNTSVTGVDVERVAGRDQARNVLAVSAHIATRGLSTRRHVHVTLSANGRPSGARDVVLPADGTANVTFDPIALSVGAVRVMVKVDPDSLPADDVFNLVVPAEVTRRVVLAVPGDVAADETLYLERALEASHDPAFRVDRRSPASLAAATLRDAVAVVAYDVPLPGGAAGTALAAWVRAGGGLVSIAATRLATRGTTSTILPGSVRGTVDRTADRGGVIGATALEHPVFSAFRAGAAAPLGSARFYRYPRVTPSADAEVVARFDDGLPALLEHQHGSGRVLLTVMPLDATSGNFPLQPTYLPFVRALVLYAAGSGSAPLWHVAGDGWFVPAQLRNPVIKAPSGKLLRPDVGRGSAAITLDEAGFYAAYEGQPSGDPLAVIAVNGAARESDLSSMPPSELLVGVAQDTLKASGSTAASLTDAERRQQLWRTLLLLAALGIAAETVMTSRGWRGTAAQLAGRTEEEGA